MAGGATTGEGKAAGGTGHTAADADAGAMAAGANCGVASTAGGTATGEKPVNSAAKTRVQRAEMRPIGRARPCCCRRGGRRRCRGRRGPQHGQSRGVTANIPASHGGWRRVQPPVY
jgi:hypothetical protein